MFRPEACRPWCVNNSDWCRVSLHLLYIDVCGFCYTPRNHSRLVLSRYFIIDVSIWKNGMFVYNAVAIPSDHSTRFTLHSLADRFIPTPTFHVSLKMRVSCAIETIYFSRTPKDASSIPLRFWFDMPSAKKKYTLNLCGTLTLVAGLFEGSHTCSVLPVQWLVLF